MAPKKLVLRLDKEAAQNYLESSLLDHQLDQNGSIRSSTNQKTLRINYMMLFIAWICNDCNETYVEEGLRGGPSGIITRTNARWSTDRILTPCNYCHHPWCVGHKSYHKALLIMFGCDGISDNASWNEVFYWWDIKLSCDWQKVVMLYRYL